MFASIIRRIIFQMLYNKGWSAFFIEDTIGVADSRIGTKIHLLGDTLGKNACDYRTILLTALLFFNYRSQNQSFVEIFCGKRSIFRGNFLGEIIKKT